MLETVCGRVVFDHVQILKPRWVLVWDEMRKVMELNQLL